jgi:hypothetical protein
LRDPIKHSPDRRRVGPLRRQLLTHDLAELRELGIGEQVARTWRGRIRSAG